MDQGACNGTKKLTRVTSVMQNAPEALAIAKGSAPAGSSQVTRRSSIAA